MDVGDRDSMGRYKQFMNYLDHPNEITRESLVSILDIMYRLAAPEAMPELLREIIMVGKLAIVAGTDQLG